MKRFQALSGWLMPLAVVFLTTGVAAQDLTPVKSHAGSFLQGQVGATYAIVVNNVGASPTTGVVTVTDTVPAGLTPTAAAGGGWVCNIAGQSVSCARADALNAAASYPTITLTVNVAPAAPPSITNSVTVSGGGDVNPANNTDADVTTIGPGTDLILSKSHSGNFVQGQTGATWTITVSNTGTGPTTGVVTVSDTLPAGVVPTAAAGSGWICNISGQAVTCARADPLSPPQSYPPIALTVNVASNAPPSVTNTATVSGGGDVNTANNTVTDTTTILPGPDLTVSKIHSGNFTQGQTGATYTITVTNNGGAPTSGTLTVVDTLPVGLVPTSASGAGWACNVGGQNVICTRSDALAPGASDPPITLTVNVASNAPSSVTNTASVSGGGDVNTANNTVTDTTTILPGPDLAISKIHTGNFVQGQTGAIYTITVTNNGGSPTSGPVTMTDVLPSSLTPTAATGTGWSCSIVAQSVTCTRSDALTSGASYPPITLTVNVAPNASSSATNTASVSGGNDVNAANNTHDDITTIGPGPDPIVSKSHSGNFVQGQPGTYTITVTNNGGSPTTGTVTTTDVIPAGLTPTAATGTGWSCSIAVQDVTCTRSDALATGASYPSIAVTVNVDPNAPPNVTNSATVSGGGDINTANNTDDDVTTIDPGPDLVLSKTSVGTFVQGQPGTYTITVTNNGGAPTSGTVTITDSIPSGLTPTAVAGTGWNCSMVVQDVTCTRNDALAPGASYPPITLTVNVAVGATSSIVNVASVAGGGDVDPSNNSGAAAIMVPALVPSLSEWMLLLFAAMLAAMGVKRMTGV